MRRRDNHVRKVPGSKSTNCGSVAWPQQLRTDQAFRCPAVTQRMPPVRFDSRGKREPTRITRRARLGSGGARLGLSQKGDLPLRREPEHLTVQGRRRPQKPNNSSGQLAAYIQSCPTLAVMPSAFFSRRQSNGGRDCVLAYLRHRSRGGMVGVFW